RDRTVTGVQTCALPIYTDTYAALFRRDVDAPLEQMPEERGVRVRIGRASPFIVCDGVWHRKKSQKRADPLDASERRESGLEACEIGRASCRERGWGQGE